MAESIEGIEGLPEGQVVLPEFDEELKRELLEALRKLSVMTQEARQLNLAHKHAEERLAEAMKQRNFFESSYEDAEAGRAIAVAEGKVIAESLKNANIELAAWRERALKEAKSQYRDRGDTVAERSIDL